ncbi:MAG: biotin transporter BioY [Candidatus Omnitrophota bacterium]|nr:MAG: biotin transporter BioY [Candidatus Omnitrophota bacterium]
MRAICLDEKKSLLAEISFIIGFSLLMVLSSYVRIPLFFSPVPVTLQTFVLYLSILFLKRKAFISQAFYIVLGLTGLPVFSMTGTGLLYLLGPTGGYIIGFFVVALVFGYFLPHQKTFVKIFLFFLIANIVIYTIGASWLIFLHHFTPGAAFSAGILPFLVGDILKIALVSSFALKGK